MISPTLVSTLNVLQCVLQLMSRPWHLYTTPRPWQVSNFIGQPRPGQGRIGHARSQSGYNPGRPLVL